MTARVVRQCPRGRMLRRIAALAAVTLLIAACSSPAPSGAAGSSHPAGSAGPGGTFTGGPSSSAGPSASPAPAPTVALAVVTGFSNYKVTALTRAQLKARLAKGSAIPPCGAEGAIASALKVTDRSAWAACVRADRIPGAVAPASTKVALLPAALVSPKVRVVPLDGADPFGEAPARNAAYPLTIATPGGWPASWTAFDTGDVRVVVSTGVNCPDRGVSRQTIVLGRGWDWMLQAGTAKYTGRHWDSRYGWWVVDAVRTGHAGAVATIIREADLAVSDFECPMTRSFVHHDSGTVFSIDPKVAPLMARAGFDVATIASDHMTNAGPGAVSETVSLFAKSGIRAVGGGANLAQALKPAVIDVRGLKFGFVGLDAIGGSVLATASTPGVAGLTTANAKKAIAAARAQGADVVFALPQWSSVEYRAGFTDFQRKLMRALFAAGADHIIGADFHWAGALSITPGGRSGNRFVTSSQGNFWFGQDWSRQTQEGVMTMLTFVGTRLAQVRLIPTVVLDDAQPNLVEPATDGQFVLHQVLDVSELKAR